MTDTQLQYDEIKGMPEAVLAYAITGLDSEDRRRQALTALEQVCVELEKWEFLGSTPAELKAKVSVAKQSLGTAFDTLLTWKDTKLPELSPRVAALEGNPALAKDSSTPEGEELLHTIRALNSELVMARAEINESKSVIGTVWPAITETTGTLAQAIETEVKNAVARVHSTKIDNIGVITTVSSKVLGVLGVIDPTLLGELGLKGLKVGLEALSEAAKMGVERYEASGMTMDSALAVYEEWDIAIASAERWKGGVKVAIHGVGVFIPKFDLVSAVVDGLVDVWFDAPVKDAKKLAAEAKKAAETKDGGPVAVTPESFWESFKASVVEQFTPTNMTEVTNGLVAAYDGMEDPTSIAKEIVNRLCTAIADVLREKFLPVKPAQAIPALDIKARLGDLSAVYGNSLGREMKPELRSEFEEAMSKLGKPVSRPAWLTGKSTNAENPPEPEVAPPPSTAAKPGGLFAKRTGDSGPQ